MIYYNKKMFAYDNYVGYLYKIEDDVIFRLEYSKTWQHNNDGTMRYELSPITNIQFFQNFSNDNSYQDIARAELLKHFLWEGIDLG